MSDTEERKGKKLSSNDLPPWAIVLIILGVLAFLGLMGSFGPGSV